MISDVRKVEQDRVEIKPENGRREGQCWNLYILSKNDIKSRQCSVLKREPEDEDRRDLLNVKRVAVQKVQGKQGRGNEQPKGEFDQQSSVENPVPIREDRVYEEKIDRKRKFRGEGLGPGAAKGDASLRAEENIREQQE